MPENIMVAYHQAREAFATDGLKGIFRERIFWKRVATPTVMNLMTIDTSRDILIEPDFQRDGYLASLFIKVLGG